MWADDLRKELREMQETARRAREADAPDRALRLFPENVERWTEVLREAALTAQRGKRPCSYAPWIAAIHEAGTRRGFQAHPGDLVAQTSIALRLRNFIEDVWLPAWPEPRPDLIEFALTVLETDVMLFRLGYAKRHLLRRLQQSPLSDADVARLNTLLHRAVLRGTGREEYRGWCRLAAFLALTDWLPDLEAWLEVEAQGAILTHDHAYHRLWQELARGNLSEADWSRLMKGGVWRPARWGVRFPDMTTVVPAGQALDQESQRIGRNAWRMLDAVAHRRASEPSQTEKG